MTPLAVKRHYDSCETACSWEVTANFFPKLKLRNHQAGLEIQNASWLHVPQQIFFPEVNNCYWLKWRSAEAKTVLLRPSGVLMVRWSVLNWLGCGAVHTESCPFYLKHLALQWGVLRRRLKLFWHRNENKEEKMEAKWVSITLRSWGWFLHHC